MYCSQCGTQNSDDAKFCHNCGFGLQAGAVDAVAVTEYAGFWRRFVAHLVDRLILAVPSGILAFVFIVPAVISIVGTCESRECNPAMILPFIMSWIWLAIIIVVGHALYFTWFESSRFQATPGKILLGIIVTDIDGKRVSFLRALGRNAGKIISHIIFNIGFIMAGITAKKQALHDMLADCLVVMKK